MRDNGVNLSFAMCLKLLDENKLKLLVSVICGWVWSFALAFCCCFVGFFFFLHVTISLSFLLFLLSFQALKLTRDVEREPFAKSAVSKWTVILFTAYDVCEPCIIFLTKQTVKRPLI